MRKSKKCVVVIPIHSSTPSEMELISFQQCFRILGNHAIKIIAPKGLNLTKYNSVIHSFNVVFIDPIWQSSIEKYNKLKLSLFFYKLFDDYEFLMTYELDAFVFKDDLLFWCEKGFDYIGSPWFMGYEKPTTEFLGVGNSGFSLRNVQAMQSAIKKIYIKEAAFYPFGSKNALLFKASTLFNYLLIYFGENHTIQRAAHKNEDEFIANVITKKIKKFNVASIEEAIKFGFEVQPKFLYQMNKSTLPMGCHAWLKYDPEFWKPFIEDFGYEVNIS